MQINHVSLPVADGRLTTGFEERHPGIHLRAAVVADLHDKPYDRVLQALTKDVPDVILIPGDLTEDLTKPPKEDERRPGLELLEACARLAPTFYSFGNHEQAACHANLRYAEHNPGEAMPVLEEWKQRVRASGAVLLEDGWTVYRGMVLGGIGSGLLNPGRIPDTSWIPAYSAVPGYKLLLCHHPEYFDRHLRRYPIDLFVSGHAHGGQWRVFGRGVFAPDQGLFPKYTSGVHEGRLVISRGVSNTVPCVPRFFNPTEILMIELTAT